MTVFPNEIPNDLTGRHHESYTKTQNNEVAQRVIVEKGIPDPRYVDRIHTSATGVITDVVQKTTYNLDGSVNAITYTDAAGAPFTPTGVISKTAVKISLGQQILAVVNSATSSLTVPANTASALVQNHSGVSIKFSTSGTDPVTTSIGRGYVLDEEDHAELESIDEINKFRAISVDNSAPGELYVEYFNV